jgi:hypothetical protein
MGSWEDDPLSGAAFTVESLTPNEPRLLQFRHEGKKLSGSLVVRGDEKDSLQVRLEPWATLNGRLVTPEGGPLTGAWLTCCTAVSRNGLEPFHRVQPGKDGRFQIEGLTPGLTYVLSVTKGGYDLDIAGGEDPKRLTIKASKTNDLGDVTVKPKE